MSNNDARPKADMAKAQKNNEEAFIQDAPFRMLGLNKAIVNKITELGYTTPTPIQDQAIPHILAGRDVMGLAQTGTGKTAAFGLPIIEAIMMANQKPAPKTVSSLILAPTRELVQQIAKNVRDCVPGNTIRVAMVTGGASMHNQIKYLARGAGILVATPGRLRDLLNRKAVSLEAAEYVVLDEADQMLDMGFVHDIHAILKQTNSERKTLMFSATMPKAIEELSKTYQNRPAKIQVSNPNIAADNIRQSVHFLNPANKLKTLKDYLDEGPDDLSLVFARTKRGAEKLKKTLAEAGYAVDSVHGDKNQSQRSRAIKAFREGQVRILVATDVAARGIDIPGVSHVYNYDLPEVAENYVHRIGRTARAGAKGRAIAFCAPTDVAQLKSIEKLMGMNIKVGGGQAPSSAANDQGQPAKPGRKSSRGRKRVRPTANKRNKPAAKAKKQNTQGSRKKKPKKSA